MTDKMTSVSNSNILQREKRWDIIPHTTQKQNECTYHTSQLPKPQPAFKSLLAKPYFSSRCSFTTYVNGKAHTTSTPSDIFPLVLPIPMKELLRNTDTDRQRQVASKRERQGQEWQTEGRGREANRLQLKKSTTGINQNEVSFTWFTTNIFS